MALEKTQVGTKKILLNFPIINNNQNRLPWMLYNFIKLVPGNYSSSNRRKEKNLGKSNQSNLKSEFLDQYSNFCCVEK